MMAPTIRDIAQLAGVSTATVSRVLSEEPGISVADETRVKILEAVEQLNYPIKKRKRSIGRHQIQTMGVIFPANEIENFYYVSLRQGLESTCQRYGFESSSLKFIWGDDSRSYSSMTDVDGLIVIGYNDNASRYFRNTQLRVVFLDGSPDEERYNSVVPDIIGGTQKALNHLVKLGHTSIGYIGFDNFDKRWETYKNFMLNKGLFEQEHCHLGDNRSIADGFQLGQQCLAKGKIARAYFVYNDTMAMGVSRAFFEAGLRIPEDVALVGFDDIPYAAFSISPLTTVRIPTESMCDLAVSLLVDGIGDDLLPVKLIVPSSLVIRESCGHMIKNSNDVPMY